MREELVCKKHVRGGHKVSATKMDARVEELLSEEEAPDPLALTQLGMSLREKLKVIKTLDSEIVEVVEETHLVDEIEQAALYKVRIYSTLIKIDRVVDSISKPMPAVRKPNVSTVPSAPPTHKVRLPKLTIKGGGPCKTNSGLQLKNFLQLSTYQK